MDADVQGYYALVPVTRRLEQPVREWADVTGYGQGISYVRSGELEEVRMYCGQYYFSDGKECYLPLIGRVVESASGATHVIACSRTGNTNFRLWRVSDKEAPVEDEAPIYLVAQEINFNVDFSLEDNQSEALSDSTS
jgi:hypothetical protein